MFGAAALPESLVTILTGFVFTEVVPTEVCFQLFQSQDLLRKLVLQIDQSFDQGLRVRPVILPVPLSPYLLPVDILIEHLSRRIQIPVEGRISGH